MKEERPHESSLRRLLPTFIIPVGSQVVLRIPKKIVGADDTRPPGSVGEVVESPSDNRHAYAVRFADGATVKAHFDELSLRRRELDDALKLEDQDLRPFVVYRCVVGSRAFGLARDESDDDWRGIFIPPARLHWSLFELPEQIEFREGSRDEVYWEIEKFLRLALQANPNVLETLWSPMILHADETARELVAMRRAFLSKHRFKTYSGYVLSQFKRMSNAFEKTGKFKAKHAMHLVRLLHSGIAAVETGEIRIDVSEHRGELCAIRDGERSFDEVRERALELDRAFQAAFARTALPEQPDFASVDAFLVRARRRQVDA